MNRLTAFVLGILMILALVSSVALIPNDAELALIRFRNKEYDRAFGRYLEMWSAGDRSISVVIPLANLYLTHGDVDHAVELMEDFVEAHPNNLEARIELGRYYQYAQRPGDYIRNLEYLSSLKPTEKRLRELSASYNFEAQYDKQIEVLKTLIELYPNTAQDFIDLTYLQASKHLYQDALETLDRMIEKHPQRFDQDLLSLSCSLGIDAGLGTEAFQQAKDWLQKNQDIDAVVQLTALFNQKGESHLAADLLAPFERYMDENPALLWEWVSIQISIDEWDSAFSKLHSLYLEDRLHRELLPELLDLSLYFSRRDIVQDIAAELNPHQVEIWMRISVIEVLLHSGETELLRKFVDAVNPESFESKPVLRAQIALVFGNDQTAEIWMQKAFSDHSLPVGDRILLADLFESRGDNEKSLSLLLQIFENGPVSADLSYRIAQLSVEVNRTEEVCRVFQKQVANSPNPGILFGWALLATISGRSTDVHRWLSDYSGPTNAQYLKDLYFSVPIESIPELALLCAQKLYNEYPSRENRSMLMTALLKSGNPQEVIQLIHQIENRNSRENEIYQTALTKAFQYGLPVEQELAQFWIDQLENPNRASEDYEEAVYALLKLKKYSEISGTIESLAEQNPQKWLYVFEEVTTETGKKDGFVRFLKEQLNRIEISSEFRENCLYLLMEHGTTIESLPYLEQLAKNNSKEWIFAYQEALLQLNERKRLVDFWRETVRRKDITDEDRRTVAFQLLQYGDKESAEKVFQRLADRGTGKGPDINQLLYLWGPRPDSTRIGWLEQKAISALNPEEKECWLRHLFNLDQYQSVTEILEGSQVFKTGLAPGIVELYARSLLQLERLDQLADFLGRQIDQTVSIVQLRTLARLAREANQEAIAFKGFLKITIHVPNDPEANRIIGQYCLNRGNYSRANDYLKNAVSADPDDYESHFYLGEVLRFQHQETAAKSAYRTSLQKLESKAINTKDRRWFKAKLLNRLNQTEKSVQLFRLLSTQYPSDIYLKADYISVLLEHKLFEEAEVLLGQPEESDD